MENKRLIHILVSFFVVPLIILALISASYLLVVVRHDALAHINSTNKMYEFFLANEARNALELNDAEYFQNIINALINEKSDLVSIELINTDRNILASAPALPNLTAPAIRIPIMTRKAEHQDLFDLDIKEKVVPDEEIIGSLVIRYNYTEDSAITQLFTHLAILIIIILILVYISYRRIYHHLIRPFGFLNNRISDMTEGAFNIIEVRPNYLDSCHRELNNVSKIFRSKTHTIETLEAQLINTQSNVDFANLTKIEMMTELVSNLDKNVDTARDLLTKLGKNNQNASLDDLIKYTAGCVDNIQRVLNDTNLILDKTDMFVSHEQVRISDFYDKLIDNISSPKINVIKGFMCDEKYLKYYLEIDDTHFYQLINKLVIFAHNINEPGPIFINVIVEKASENSASIVIEIKDSSDSPVLSSEDINAINAYVNGNEKSISIISVDYEALRIIKYLVMACNAQFVLLPGYGHGHSYRLSLDRKLSSSPEQNIKSIPSPAITGFCFHNGSPDITMENHLKHTGIEIRSTSTNDPDLIERVIASSSNVDFWLLDFTTSDKEVLIQISKSIKEKQCNFIIAFISIEQSNDSDFIDRIFNAGVKEVIPKPYTAATLINVLKTTKKNNKQFIERLLKQFTL